MVESEISTNDLKTDNQDIRSGSLEIVKQAGDIVFSSIILIILSPVMILLTIVIKASGKGPVIYSQDRIGKDGKPFVIYKFRSMVYNAEKSEPLLSKTAEERITKIGKFMRKYRIDEIPNILNVLKGEMSLVGPRPERQYFIDQIIKIAPEYKKLHKVKPGVTSWGQVKYGYASNVDEMIKRLEYDLYYLKHRSIWFDLKIIIFTVGIIFKGKGI